MVTEEEEEDLLSLMEDDDNWDCLSNHSLPAPTGSYSQYVEM